MQSRQSEARCAVAEWTDKARQAEARRRSVRETPAADPEQLTRLDELVKDAVRRSVRAEQLAGDLDGDIADRSAHLAALKKDLAALRRKRDDLADRRSELIARESLTEARSEVAAVLADLSESNPTSELARIESDVRGREHRSRPRELLRRRARRPHRGRAHQRADRPNRKGRGVISTTPAPSPSDSTDFASFLSSANGLTAQWGGMLLTMLGVVSVIGATILMIKRLISPDGVYGPS